MSATVLCTLDLPDPFSGIVESVARLRSLGRLPAHDELCDELRRDPVDVLCPQLRDRVDAEVLDAGLPRMRCVSVYAVGYDNVDVAAATERGIVVGNTPGVLTDATADCAMALLLAAARRIREGDEELRAGRFHGWEPTYLLGLELRDALLGIVGFGRIGQAVARRALGFGMRIAYFDSTAPPVDESLRAHVTRVGFDELVRDADVISLHVPLSQDTRHLVGEAVLRRMKRTAVLVNTSRGAVVDEAALVRALREGWIAAAGLDVYEREPELSPGLAQCSTAVLAPHLGSATVTTRAAMAELCAHNAVDALSGTVPRNCVNPQAWGERAPASLLSGG
ncbi:MAG: D-glycerate dehydrogenase [Candidatus Dormibacteraeota bacterium]|nr:D-glycerate dehydrogenase [Candidatus Dormibacteraeota bacterium]MBV9524371.1 D-glycerate dehydrogenase [Candidatus Dormibacteraeota bacterium]